MGNIPDIARIAALLADPARASILWTLIDCSARSASELASAAYISPQSASAHLNKLVEGGMLEVTSKGRHRYFKIANSEVACMIESMASLSAEVFPNAPPCPPIVRPMPNEFMHARTCYDHLAGKLAVDILAAMQKKRWLRRNGAEFSLTRVGEKALNTLGLETSSARTERRVLARPCKDLTQRKAHLGGALGAALLNFYLTQGWIIRSRQSRTVAITPIGHQAFQKILDASECSTT